MDEEQQELVLSFIEEGYELLDEAEPLVIELESRSKESGEVDIETLNTIFRLFHSLKGGAGFLDLTTVGKVTHEAETLLDLFRKGKGTISSGHIDLLNRTCDFLRKLLGNIETELNEDGFDEDAKAIIVDLKTEIGGITGEDVSPNEQPKIAEKEPGQVVEETNDGNAVEAETTTPEVVSEDIESLEDLQLTITPEMIKQFTAESEDLLTATEESFLVLDKDPTNEEHIGDAFRALHSFKGNCGFLGYQDMERLSHQTETVLDSLRSEEFIGNSQLFSLLLDLLDFLRDGIAQAAEGKDPKIPGIDGLIHLLQDTAKKLEKAPPKEQKAKQPDAANSQKAAAQKPALEQKVKPPASSQAKKSKSKPATAAKPTRSVAQRQSVRVDVEKLDVLLDLVGELVIAEAMVAQNPDLQGVVISLDRFEKSTMHLNKITRDLQDVSTSIRMIPLSGTFRRMIRLVRDLAQKTGKKVDLEIIGEQTEVDKTVIEQMTDPLVHIIRNSVDHGIGSPKDRKESGKSETGRVTLEAQYVGGEVWISIKDDGQGLNRERIVAKAIEKSLIEGDGSDIPDEEIWPLIFHPGFSTAAEITDVSGRGVGMDVVRRNIENIRGKVDIKSVQGEGSAVILRIPLTLAIIDGMIIRVGTNRYIIPIVGIKEAVHPNAKDITQTMDGQEILNVREQLLPVIRFHEIYNVEPSHFELSDGIIMIVENAGKQFCLFVDELIGQQQIVIKGLSEYVGHLRGISGCTILGDGAVCLIIDLADLLQNAEQVAEHYSQEASVSV